MLKYRWLAVQIFAIVVLTTVLVSIFSPRVYRATAKVLVEQKPGESTLLAAIAAPQELTALSKTGSPIDTQIELMKTRPILEKVISNLRLVDDRGKPLSYEGLLAKLDAGPVKNTDIIFVSVDDHGPGKASEIANEIANVFVADNQLGTQRQAREARTFLEKQVQTLNTQVDKAAKALQEFKQREKTVDLPEEAKNYIEQLAKMDADASATDASYKQAAARRDSAKVQMEKQGLAVLASTSLEDSPIIIDLKTQLANAEVALAEAKTKYTPIHPKVIALAKRVDDLKAGIKGTVEKQVVQSKTTTLNPIHQSLELDYLEASVSAQALKAQAGALHAAAAQFSSHLTSLSSKERELARLTREQDVLGQTYQLVMQRLQEARINEVAQIGNVRVVEPAVTPTAFVRPRLVLNTFLAVILGFILALGTALIADTVNDLVRSPDEMETLLGAPQLGLIPHFEREEKYPTLRDFEAHSSFAEAYRTLRANVKFAAVDRRIKTILVSSLTPDDGKTTTAVNLGITSARAGAKTLLLETDFRRPSLHKFLQAKREKGLTNYLADGIGLEDIIQPTAEENLSCITCGPIPPNPVETLESSRLMQVLAALAEQFDLVILDSPPVLAVSDPLVLAHRVDGVVIVTDAEKAKRPIVALAKKTLAAAGAPVLGFVLNKIHMQEMGYYYRDYYYYKYKRYYEEDGEKKEVRRKRHRRPGKS